MGDVSAEPSMEDILSSIKRIIAEESEPVTAARTRRALRAAPTAPPAAEADDVLELSDPVSAPTPTSTPMPTAAAAPSPTAKPAARQPILSSTTAQASRHSLEALSRLVVKPEPGGPDTLEGLVRELLRPMLREWLDAHLPEMVEAMVSREIARIAGQV